MPGSSQPRFGKWTPFTPVLLALHRSFPVSFNQLVLKFTPCLDFASRLAGGKADKRIILPCAT